MASDVCLELVVVRHGLTQWNLDKRYQGQRDIELLMPDAKPKVAETYLCTTIRLDVNNTYYVTGFDPRAEMGTAHHMLLYGCEVSYS